jgi:hypothetical protein
MEEINILEKDFIKYNSENECIADRPGIYGQFCFKLQTTMSTKVYWDVL